MHSLTEVDFPVVDSELALQNLNHEVNGLMRPRGLEFAHELCAADGSNAFTTSASEANGPAVWHAFTPAQKSWSSREVERDNA